MSDALAPKKRRLLANFDCQPVLRHIRHASRMSIAPCGMWALQSVLDDMLRRVLLLSINDDKITMQRYVFGQEPAPPYPVLVLHRAGCEDPPARALWKRRKQAVKHYGLVIKHCAPVVQSCDAYGFISRGGKFWIPPLKEDRVNADEDVFGDQELVDEEINVLSSVDASSEASVAVEAIRLIPIVEHDKSGEDEDSASGWFWENESGDLIRYEMIEQAQLEAAYQLYQADANLFQHPLTIAAHPNRRYLVDFQENIQMNLDTQNTRSILRQIRQDVSLQEIFAALKQEDMLSGQIVRVLSKFDEPSEICIASWQETSSSRNPLTIGDESTGVSFSLHSVSFKEIGSIWEFDVCVASISKLEEIRGIVADECGLNVLMQGVRLKFGHEMFSPSACKLYPPVALSDVSSTEAIFSSAPAADSAARDIEDMSEEEQLLLAMSLSSASDNAANSCVDASNAEVSSSVVSPDSGNASGQAASVTLLRSVPKPSLPVCAQVERQSGICCHLIFSVPFDTCASLPSASAEANLCVDNQMILLGTLQFEKERSDEEDGRRSLLEVPTTSIILESFRMVDDNGDFTDEQVDMSLIPASVGRFTFLDHVMIDNAVRKVLSQELLVSLPRPSSIFIDLKSSLFRFTAHLK
jgi:hypothetical protein